ncbi:MAG: hypothetical protein IPL26_28075 [Leptospiraceae bacterium]|nr:hypothetical protein [Leptospiraceae bacterium]
MNYKKILLFTIAFLFLFNCGKTIIKVNSPTSNPEGKEEDYHKRYASNWLGFQEYSVPVTPNRPQKFRSTWFTFDDEKEKHKKPVCTKNVDSVVIVPDWLDSIIHGLFGGITSTRSVLIYCNK